MDDKPFEPITTQEQLDALLKERLRRAREKAVEPYADYDELKGRVEAAEKAASEAEELRRRADEAEGAVARMTEEREREATRARVSEDTGVPARLIQGSDEESMRKSAEDLAAWAKPGPSARVSAPGKFAEGGEAKKANRDAFADVVGAALGVKNK